MKKLPEPYRSHIIHNARMCARFYPEYFNAVMNLCRIQVWIYSGWTDGITYWPEVTHYFFNETPTK